MLPNPDPNIAFHRQEGRHVPNTRGSFKPEPADLFHEGLIKSQNNTIRIDSIDLGRNQGNQTHALQIAI